MKRDLQVQQAAAYRRYQMFLAEFYQEARSLLEEDPNDPVNLELVELHNNAAMGLIRSVQKVLTAANRNFLRVVTDANDKIETDPDVRLPD